MIDYSERYNSNPTIFNDIVHKGSLFHYTSIAGFLLMMEDIRDKKCHIFPGHMRYQNDKQELTEGIEFVKKHISDIMKKFWQEQVEKVLEELNSNIYITCFSASRDLLEQWKYYGSNCGLSIEFDFMECEGFFCADNIPNRSEAQYSFITKEDKETIETKQEENFINFDDQTSIIDKKQSNLTRFGISLTPIDVLYDEKKKKNLLNKILRKNLIENMRKLHLNNNKQNQKQYIQHATTTFVTICKNCYFEHEKESRLLFFPLGETKIKYREKNNRILPYLKCTIVNKDVNKYPIKSITVGPGNNQNLVFNAVVNLIDGDDSKFFSEEDCCRVIKSEQFYKNEEELRASIENGKLECYCNGKEEKVLVYCTNSGILIYKSPIPFRD